MTKILTKINLCILVAHDKKNVFCENNFNFGNAPLLDIEQLEGSGKFLGINQSTITKRLRDLGLVKKVDVKEKNLID